MPMMPFMGVRISWLMLARNSLFAALARSASARALSASFSAPIRSAIVLRRRVSFSRLSLMSVATRQIAAVGFRGQRSQRQLQRDRAPVARTEGVMSPALAPMRPCLQQNVKRERAPRAATNAPKASPTNSVERHFQQIGKPAIAIENRAVGREGDRTLVHLLNEHTIRFISTFEREEPVSLHDHGIHFALLEWRTGSRWPRRDGRANRRLPPSIARRSGPAES